jgi:CNT family concentrative nucleoside transporter
MTEIPVSFSIVSILRGLLGVAVIIGILYLCSYNKKRIDWKLIGAGLTAQLVFALCVLYVPFVGHVLEFIGKCFIRLMDFTQVGMSFLLGSIMQEQKGFVFLIHSLPVIVFFSAIISLLYHWNIIQKIVGAFSWALRKIMKISGAEGLVVSGNIFMGMTESPVMIKNYLPTMNRSEIFLVMVSGMGTIAGTVMGTYIAMLAGPDPMSRVLFAKHLLSASLMAAPASIVVAKLVCPQTEEVSDHVVKQKYESKHSGALDALAAGTTTGVKLMVNIAALLLVFVSLVALCNFVLKDLIGAHTGLNQWITDISGGKLEGLTFQAILGIVLSPFMWIIGVPFQDMGLVGSLLGQKLILNEFVAYSQLEAWKEAGLFFSQKSIVMATYILCGFANIGSIGILLGGLNILAPDKREMISKLGVPAMICGALVSILSATIIGMML